MKKLTCPKPFEFQHAPPPAKPVLETFPDFVVTLVKRTPEFGKWPAVLHALDILQAVKSKVEGDEILLEDDSLRMLAKAVRAHTWLPEFAIALATAGFFQVIDEPAKTLEKGK